MKTVASSFEEQIGIAAMIGILVAAAAFLECAGPILKLPVLKFAVLLGLAFHECAHGAAAKALGDTTAADEGRLTLNPLKHLHPVGTLLILAFGIGWARPVSVAADDVRFGRWGLAGVALAGPLANLTIFLACMAVNFRVPNPPETGVAGLVDQVALANFFLFGLNILADTDENGHHYDQTVKVSAFFRIRVRFASGSARRQMPRGFSLRGSGAPSPRQFGATYPLPRVGW